MNNDHIIEEKLKMIKVKPLTPTEKNILWSAIAPHLTHRHVSLRTRSMYEWFRGRGKRVWIAAFLILSLLVGSATVAAADTSRPGDFLFPVDLAVEKIRLVITPEKNEDVLRIKFAEERIGEAKSVLDEFAVAAFAGAMESSNGAELTVRTKSEEGDTTIIMMQTTSSSTASTTTETSTTTATGNSFTAPQHGTIKVKREVDERSIENAKRALEVALQELEKARANLHPDNIVGRAAIDQMIADLKALAENHINELNTFKAEIQEKGGNLKVKIEATTNELKTKFKFEENSGKKNRGESVSFTSNGSGSSTSIAVQDTGVKIELKTKHDNDGEDEFDDNDMGKKEQGRKKNKDHDNDGDDEENDEDDDEDDHNGKKVTICHIPARTLELAHTIYVAKESAKAHVAHGDILGSCKKDNGGNATTTPDVVAPVISDISATTSTSTATIAWNTNEEASSKIWYSTGTPFALAAPTPNSGSSSFVASHSVALVSLTASTTYYYVAESKDASGNTATSSVRSFTTAALSPPPDITAPTITGLSATSTTASSTSIIWTTNEPATSKVWYATTTPLTIDGGTLFQESTALVTSHSVPLASLTASTTHYYSAVSKDASGNTATSTELSFVTD